jgi:hypothetical protein
METGISIFQSPYVNGDSPFPHEEFLLPVSIWEVPYGDFNLHMEMVIHHFHVGICRFLFPFSDHDKET